LKEVNSNVNAPDVMWRNLRKTVDKKKMGIGREQ
jgi:hypothetical protein